MADAVAVDDVVVILEGADGPMTEAELVIATGRQKRDVSAAIQELAANSVIIRTADGFAFRRHGTPVALDPVEDDLDWGAEAPSMASQVPSPSAAPSAASRVPRGPDPGVTVGMMTGLTAADVLAAIIRDGGGLRVRAEVILAADDQGRMHVVELVGIRGLA